MPRHGHWRDTAFAGMGRADQPARFARTAPALEATSGPQQDSDMKTARRRLPLRLRLTMSRCVLPRQPIDRPSHGVTVSRLLTSCRRKTPGNSSSVSRAFSPHQPAHTILSGYPPGGITRFSCAAMNPAARILARTASSRAEPQVRQPRGFREMVDLAPVTATLTVAGPAKRKVGHGVRVFAHVPASETSPVCGAAER